MAYVTVPKDLTRVKSKVVLGLTKRQLICFGGALLVGVPLFLLIRGRVPTSAAALIMVFAMLPGFLLALYERHGQPLEVVVWQIIQCSFIQPKERPYGMIFFFGCLGLYFTSQFARENSDAFYTATLPIKKRHVVKSKCLLFVSIEIAQLIICIPFSIIRLWTLPDGNPVGIEANVAYFGFGLIVYAIFNFLYLTVLFQSAYQVGKAFVIAIIPATAIIALMEYSVHLPSFTWLDSLQTGDLIRQLPILGIGILIYIVGNILTYRVASKRFEHVDL